MARMRIKRSHSVWTRRMRNFSLSCTLLAMASILVISSTVEATNMPKQERQLRGNRATPEATQGSARRTKAEPDRKSHTDETTQSSETTTGLQKMTRIVGGANVQQPGKYPWFTRVLGGQDTGEGLDACGGALIAPDLVLTAAHCGDPIKVYPGRHNLDLPAPENIDVASFVRHPEYGTGTYTVDFDIMIVQLTDSSTTAKPIRLNFNDDYPVEANESLTMLGFGSTIGGPATGLPDPPNEQARILQTAETLYVPFETCAVSEDPDSGVMYGISPTQTAVSPHWFCTTGPDVGSELVTATCYGDSGGPILKEDFFEGDAGEGVTNDLLLAVISGSSGYCGNRHLPLWNQRVSYHKRWLIETGCQLSKNPPPEWNCNMAGLTGLGIAPEDNSIYFPVTAAPVAPTAAPVAPTAAPIAPTAAPVAPTAAPVAPTAAPVAPTPAPIKTEFIGSPTAAPVETEFIGSPTAAPIETEFIALPTAAPIETEFIALPTAAPVETEFIASPTAEPTTPSPTDSPTTASPTPEPTPRPTTEKPNPFPVPILDPDATEEPTPYRRRKSRSSSSSEDVDFVCPICEDDDEIVTNPESIVFVPVLGQKTCGELFEDAIEGKIGDDSVCDSILLLAKSVCDCAEATPSPTKSPSEGPTSSPTTSRTQLPSAGPVATPSAIPTDSPSLSPSGAPSSSPVIPTDSPTSGPTPTPGSCESIRIANLNRDPAKMVNVTIDFAFEDVESANSVGWFLSDPDYECFRVGSAIGRFMSLQVSERYSLVGGIDYKFVVEVDGRQAHGNYTLISNNETLAHNLISGILYDDEGTFFKTPRNNQNTTSANITSTLDAAAPQGSALPQKL